MTATPATEVQTRRMNVKRAINETLRDEMQRDPTVIILGCDVGVRGNPFGVTKGLYEEFGALRVLDTPISEAAIVGSSLGAAATGLRPIAEILFSDWITIGMDQLVNQIAKIRYMFGGAISVPLVIRAPVGAGGGQAAQHSQSFENWFSAVPGLQIVMPSTPADVKGLLRTAIRSDDPVLFFEHKRGYEIKGQVPVEEYTIPFGQADVVREGSDVTVVVRDGSDGSVHITFDDFIDGMRLDEGGVRPVFAARTSGAFDNYDIDNVHIEHVPEPGTLTLIGLAGTLLLGWRRRSV